MVWNWLRRHPRLVDTAIVLLLGAIYVANAAYERRYAFGIPLALIQTVPLLMRRRRPLAVFAIVVAGTLASAFAYETVIPLAPAVAVYTMAVQLSRRRSGPATAVALVGLAAAAAETHDIASFVFIAAAWVLGDNIGTRRAYFDELEEKAARLEREREAKIKRAAEEEQARISRELHDVIAHNVSVMTVQAAAARDVFEREPERAREALGSIESTGRAALTELRRLLGSIRTGDGPDLTPQPGLDRLDDLVAQVRSAGLAVDVIVEGEPRRL